VSARHRSAPSRQADIFPALDPLVLSVYAWEQHGPAAELIAAMIEVLGDAARVAC
jgi:hypothetical protein